MASILTIYISGWTIMAVRSIVIIQKKATEPAKLNIKNVIGPASISLGAMIGTGAIIGVRSIIKTISKWTSKI